MFRLGLMVSAVLLTSQITIISSVSRLDLKSGRISGEKSDFYMDIPAIWPDYLTADRERITNGLYPLEKLNFYFIPSDSQSKSPLFLSMNIYSKFHYSPAPNHHKLLETNKYIFTVYLPKENSLKNKTDITRFNNMRSTADDQFLIGLIHLHMDDEKLYKNTIWVNGKQLNTKAITDSNVTYLPIRDVCEQLGYSVGWLSDQKAITLRRNNTYEILLVNNINANHGFSLTFSNERAFISSLYFISVLKLNVEIDEQMNVMLNES